MNQSIIDASAIEEWITGNFSEKTVETTLLSKGYESNLVKEYLFEFKRLRRVKNNLIGLMIFSYTTLAAVGCYIVLHKF
jgi:hypothetical protein